MDFKTVTHSICGHDIRVRIPSDPEAVLSEAANHDSEDSGASDPYWCLVWDAAPRTAKLILEHDWEQKLPESAIEIGCGVGLSGIAAQIVGMDVTYSDYSSPAVDQAVHNAAENGFADSKGLVLDWNSPTDQQFEFIFGSDVLYDKANHVPVLNVLKRMMPSTGEAWIGDMGRYALEGFVELALAEKWNVELFNEDGTPLAKPVHQSFQLLKITAG